jgi:LacI family transcriptional regulator
MALKVRIEDVAEAAGVSMKTVSRVLNNEPNVRAQTRELVMAAVRKLRYVPNLSARSLAGNRSYLVALVYNNPSPHYLMEVMGGVLEACLANQYNMLLCPCDTDGPRLLGDIDALMARSRPDGLVLTPPLTDSGRLVAQLERAGVPFASISPKRQDRRSGVAMDETRAAFDMVQHLAGLGHARIAHIVGHRAHGASGWRLEGYRSGLAHAGIAYDPSLVVQGEFSFESGARGAEALLALPLPPTAIFAANDDMAAGVIRVLLDRNLRVPEDISVCGFDDTPLSQQIFPALTTVHQPTHDMGRLATQALIESIREPQVARMQRVPYTLQLRRSTGPAP